MWVGISISLFMFFVALFQSLVSSSMILMVNLRTVIKFYILL